ncbi:MFS transporter [Marinilabilia rubra]|uniref:MFS transporter n=1 Tax=Marinilabilia rubra TaxID=2162893 RepID=A0A2U2B748_9BACT|nr:MFS transporter [Marinilabilia rubra]PWD98887.1 MFS transporter [Marinilabilia rubra]
MTKKTSLAKVLPVLFGFFIMGFVDVVGISTSYVQKDFQLSDSIANLLPMMVFLWFAVFSVPTGMLMNKIGRKNTVLLSMVVTFIAMLVPLVAYDYVVVLVAFALLGIGNTILQVSLNPLVSNVVSQDQLTSRLTLGQFLKAIASFLGPIIAGFAAVSLGSWKMLFPVFAGITLLSSLWLLLTPIPRDERVEETTSFGEAFGLLKDKTILLLFLGILFVVGVDVGMNMATPKFLMARTGLPLEEAGLGTSLYFAARTAGALIGAILLAKFNAMKFFKISMVVAIGAMVVLIFSQGAVMIFAMVAVIGFALANIFSIIFSMALQKRPERGNEISGLMIMGVAGGAVLPPVMGIASDAIGQVGGLLVLLVAMGYLMATSILVKINK